MQRPTAFVAYPSNPAQISQVLTDAIKRVNAYKGRLYTGWEENDIAGRSLTAPIFSGLNDAELLVADISVLNFNVTFEIGYAIGLGRRVVLIKSSEIRAEDTTLAGRIGILIRH
mgnify:CR=1 FL=1